MLLSLSVSVLTAIFPVGPELAGSILDFIRAKDDGGVGDNWSFKSQIVITNKCPLFYRPDALHVAQPTVSKH